MMFSAGVKEKRLGKDLGGDYLTAAIVFAVTSLLQNKSLHFAS